MAMYDSLLELAKRTERAIADLHPHDRIDVQSFIWVVGAYTEANLPHCPMTRLWQATFPDQALPARHSNAVDGVSEATSILTIPDGLAPLRHATRRMPCAQFRLTAAPPQRSGCNQTQSVVCRSSHSAIREEEPDLLSPLRGKKAMFERITNRTLGFAEGPNTAPNLAVAGHGDPAVHQSARVGCLRSFSLQSMQMMSVLNFDIVDALPVLEMSSPHPSQTFGKRFITRSPRPDPNRTLSDAPTLPRV